VINVSRSVIGCGVCLVCSDWLVQVATASASVDNGCALNHCRWHSAGHMIAAGDDSGHIHMYDVGEVLPSLIFFFSLLLYLFFL